MCLLHLQWKRHSWWIVVSIEQIFFLNEHKNRKRGSWDRPKWEGNFTRLFKTIKADHVIDRSGEEISQHCNGKSTQTNWNEWNCDELKCVGNFTRHEVIDPNCKGWDKMKGCQLLFLKPVKCDLNLYFCSQLCNLSYFL